MEPLTPRALERRLKRYVMKETHEFLAVGAPGFERVLLAEVENLPGVTDARTVRGGVEFRGPFVSVYHANLRLATAHRLLWRVAEFLAQSGPMLYNKAAALPWERYLGFERDVRFHVSSRGSRLNHPQGAAETLYSAVNKALEPLGLAVQTSEDAPLTVHARLFRDRCTLSIDTSGEHLHRRGYRTHVGEAPIRETLAAGILKTVGLEDYDLIVDPMCGSGTFLLEAARLLGHAAPGKDRRFAFEHLPSFQPTLWERLKREAAAEETPVATTLLGFDKDARVLTAARANAERAGVAGAVRLEVADALTLPYGGLRAGFRRPLLVCNPPYGKRLESGDTSGGARQLVADLSARLGQAPGWTVALLTPNPAWTGLAADERLEFANGGGAVTLLVGHT